MNLIATRSTGPLVQYLYFFLEFEKNALELDKGVHISVRFVRNGSTTPDLLGGKQTGYIDVTAAALS